MKNMFLVFLTYSNGIFLMLEDFHLENLAQNCIFEYLFIQNVVNPEHMKKPLFEKELIVMQKKQWACHKLPAPLILIKRLLEMLESRSKDHRSGKVKPIVVL